jgi:hypothetical protein
MATLAPSQLDGHGPMASARARRRWFSFYRLGLALVALATVGLFTYGFDYYILDLAERVHHTEFRELHPSGRLGYLYGVLASCMLVFNLLYLVRRKLPRARLGSMQAWLNAHVISGLGAYALVVFHSAFQQRTLLASGTFWSLTIVALTGIVGRYLKSLTPRPEVERMECNLRALNALSTGLGEEVRGLLRTLQPTDIGAAPSLYRCLRTIPAWRNDAVLRGRAISHAARTGLARAPHLTLQEQAIVPVLVSETTRLAVEEVRSVAAVALLRTWRSLHRFLAIMMMTTVVVHIATAWSFGYRWIWSQ